LALLDSSLIAEMDLAALICRTQRASGRRQRERTADAARPLRLNEHAAFSDAVVTIRRSPGHFHGGLSYRSKKSLSCEFMAAGPPPETPPWRPRSPVMTSLRAIDCNRIFKKTRQTICSRHNPPSNQEFDKEPIPWPEQPTVPNDLPMSAPRHRHYEALLFVAVERVPQPGKSR